MITDGTLKEKLLPEVRGDEVKVREAVSSYPLTVQDTADRAVPVVQLGLAGKVI